MRRILRRRDCGLYWMALVSSELGIAERSFTKQFFYRCFLLQVPISAVALFLGWLVIKNPLELHPTWKEIKTKVDFVGALLLVTAISIQLVGLSLGGNELPWSNGWVIGSLVGSVVLLGLFVLVEAKTTAIPVIPLRQLYGRNPVAIQIANVCAGTAAYAVRSIRALVK